MKHYFNTKTWFLMLFVCFRNENACVGYADAQTDSMCPSEVRHNWRYFDGTGTWPDAGKGLFVKCISETGRTQNKLQGRPSVCMCYALML